MCLGMRVSVRVHVWRGHEFCGRLALSAGIFKAKQTDRLTDRQTSRHVLLPVAFDVDLSLRFASPFCLFVFAILDHSIM